ncbi:peptidase family M3 [Niveomyces insectorum RCEF 264]|uniref:Peptidase family M3 n=1 Tax=Niveomyces insectorum RCEF 264 TaxID=1081102 RepID=A0A167XTT1_9HYPO|nr:peptidase family M3 [Niveomyces insectorum RCEF 264]
MVTTDYRLPPEAPFVFNVTPESIAQENELLIDRVQSVLNGVASIPIEQVTFENVCVPLITLEDMRQLVVFPMDLCGKLSADAAVRAAADEAGKTRAKFEMDARHEGIFRRLEVLYQKRDTLTLHPEHLKWLVEERRSYVREGMLLVNEKLQNRYKHIKKRLLDLDTEFEKVLGDEVGPVLWFTPEELTGVPDDKLDRLERGTGEYQGKLKLDLSTPGYQNTAAYRLELKMAKTPQAVSKFLEDVLRRIQPYRHAQVAELLAIKKADLATRGLPAEDEVYSWDVAYYRRRLELTKLTIDREKIREYFPILPTVRNMLSLFGSLFGFVFMEIGEERRAQLSPTGRASDLVWHEDVIMYSVWDDPGEGGGFRGYLYLDLYFREGKHRGYQCSPINLGFEQSDGTKKCPSTVLMTIFPKPTADRPCLLTHSEMKLLFHELGHGIHDLSGSSKCSRFFGAETAGDFNEAPSQMLEQWCYDPRGLKAISCHYQTGEQIPDSMVQALVAAKVSSELSTLVGMMRIALWDMEVYSATERIDLSEVYIRIMVLLGTRGPEDKHGYVQWNYLVSGGEASMYQYMWSKVHAMDMFESAFQADPLDGAAGRRYRHMVLEKGATQDEMKTLADFLRREPSSEAYFRSLEMV